MQDATPVRRITRTASATTPDYGVPGAAVSALAFAFIVVASLYLARSILMPFALAILLSFMLSPLVRRLQRLRVPKGAAVISVVLVAFAGIFAIGGLMVTQVNQLAADLPSYQATLRDKIHTLRGAATGTSTLERASEVLEDLSSELNRPDRSAAAAAGARAAAPNPEVKAPIPVQIQEPEHGALQTVVALISPLIDPLVTTGLVIIFVIFILLQRQDLRNRLVRLAGSHDMQRTTAALDDAGRRLSRLFLTQLALNAAFGLIIGVGWWIIGVPSAPLWGILAVILRFMPYIGTWLSAIFPLLLAAAVGPDWSMFIWAASIFLVVDILVGQFIEPMLQGHSTGLSPVAVIASATFWTWLWGPIGLVLATPLTLCLVVLGRHVERLKFLDVMFGDQPALTPAELAYQRLLALDPVEAAEQARQYLRDKPLIAYYQDIFVPTLKLAQADEASGRLEGERLQRVREAAGELIDDLADHEDKAEAAVEETDDKPLAKLSRAEDSAELAAALPKDWAEGKPVLCVPGVGEIDEALALIIAQLIERHGIGARAEDAEALSMSRIFGLDTKGIKLVCLCYVEPVTNAQMRYAIRRLRRKAPDAHILVSLMDEAGDVEDPTPNVSYARGPLQETVEAIFSVAAREADPADEITPGIKTPAEVG
ncbi:MULTISPECIES: AI-2E family transporter [Rhodomicrobium]|uniref:AI-2E family transporter n=1 Tax=Rhodomicrobium TaxID=1068 RepID=UPI001482DC7F|nr:MULTISPECIES: AI-2E family transporter [Rhodomicrobium]